MTYRVFLVDPIGTATSVDAFLTLEEAEDAAAYLMECRDWSQVLDGTTFEAREEVEA